VLRDPQSGVCVTVDINQLAPGSTTWSGQEITGPLLVRDLLWFGKQPDGSNAYVAAIFDTLREAKPHHVTFEHFRVDAAGSTIRDIEFVLSLGPAHRSPMRHRASTMVRIVEHPQTGVYLQIDLEDRVAGEVNGVPSGPMTVETLVDLVGESKFHEALFKRLAPIA
jgi:hypothetical protein